jgi:hypothetical protein
MAYGLSTCASVETGPAEMVAGAEELRAIARSWRILGEARRLEMVERTVRASNDPIHASHWRSDEATD